MTSRELLLAARARIADPKNWIKGCSNNGTGGYCVMGACWAVDEGLMYLEAGKLLAKTRPVGFMSNTGYNDDPATTHQGILAWIGRALDE